MRARNRSYEPVRKVNTRGAFRPTGRFSSRKMGRCCSWESSVERDFIHLLEFDRDVIEYYEQPFWVSYTFEEENCKACPDFLAIYSTGEEVVWEVKQDEFAQTDEFKARTESIAKVLGRRGQSYQPITDVDIRSGRRLENIKELFAYLHVEPNPSEVLTLWGIFDEQAHVSIGDLLLGTHGRPFSKSAIYGLLAQRTLEMDIEGLLNNGTLVSNYSLYRLFQGE